MTPCWTACSTTTSSRIRSAPRSPGNGSAPAAGAWTSRSNHARTTTGGSTGCPHAQLTLEDSWAEEPPIFRVGEPVTRTVTVRAQGAEGAQIPPLNLAPAEGLRVYPEQPVSETRTDGKRVFGVSRQSMAIVPKKAGALVVPEIKVSWWDTDARRERITHIPAWRVTAEPGSSALPQQEPAPITEAPSTPHKTAGPEQTASAPEEQPTPHDLTAVQAYWPWLVGAGVLILASLTGWLGRRKARPKDAGHMAYPAKPDPQASRAGYRAAQGAFRQTCEANDAAGAARTLLAWAAEEWPDRPPRSLGAVAARVGQGADLIRELDRNLYASEAAQWRGESLWEALRGGLTADSHPAATNGRHRTCHPCTPNMGEAAEAGWGSPQLFVSRAGTQKSWGKPQPTFAVYCWLAFSVKFFVPL